MPGIEYYDSNNTPVNEEELKEVGILDKEIKGKTMMVMVGFAFGSERDLKNYIMRRVQ